MTSMIATCSVEKRNIDVSSSLSHNVPTPHTLTGDNIDMSVLSEGGFSEE